MMAVDTAPLETVAFMQALLRRFWDMSALLPSLDPAGRGLSAVVADLQLIHLCEEVTESGYRHEGAPHRKAAAQESPA